MPSSSSRTWCTSLRTGVPPLQAAIEGAGGIAFTVVTISLSLVAAFLPLMFMGGTIGRFLQEFALTVTFAIAVSTVVALTVTPMLCGHYLKTPPRERGAAVADGARSWRRPSRPTRPRCGWRCAMPG